MRNPSTYKSQQYLHKANGDVWGGIDQADNPLVAGAGSRVRTLGRVVWNTELNIES
jgi:hypothetical protein